MKTILLAASLMLGTAAIAQTTQDPAGTSTTTDTTSQDQPAPAQTTDPTTTDPAQTTQDTGQPSGQTVDDPSQSTGPQGVTQQGTTPNGTGQAPAGANQSMGTMSGNMSNVAGMSAQPAASYPPCSRTVTDRCVQTYERGVRRRR